MKQLLLLGALIFSSVTAAQTTTSSGDVLIDEIVAIVNNGVILGSEVIAETQFLTKQASLSGQNLPVNAQLRERVLERLINQQIQRQRAKELGIEVDQPSISEAIDTIASNNNLNAFDFRNALEQQGFNYNYYRESIKHELLMSRLIQRDVEQNINISDQEITDFLSSTSNPTSENRAYNLQHILIAEASSSSSKIGIAREKANALVSKLRAGADFAETAAKESAGRMALSGGDLGWRKLKELPQFLHDAVEAAKEGEISNPVQSPDGFHIVRINDVRLDKEESTIETRIRHIFISDNSETYKNKGEEILIDISRQIKNGESFETLAGDFSEDPNSSANGGELPWFVAGDLPPEMESTALNLEKGIVSTPFKTRFGWHILEVLDRRETGINDEKQRRNAELSLRRQKVEQESTRWSRRLRGDAYVEIKKK